MTNNWIKCSDRMPEMGERVLIYAVKEFHYEHDRIEIAALVDNILLAWEQVPKLRFEVCEDSGSYYNADNVTHWQPLPAKPQDSLSDVICEAKNKSIDKFLAKKNN
jgi:hypothetical protein